jgi:hypothetical protein
MSVEFFKNDHRKQSDKPEFGDNWVCETAQQTKRRRRAKTQRGRTAKPPVSTKETIMSKYILSAIAALTILSGISSAAIAARGTSGNGYSSEQAGDSFPENFWDELSQKAGG